MKLTMLLVYLLFHELIMVMQGPGISFKYAIRRDTNNNVPTNTRCLLRMINTGECTTPYDANLCGNTLSNQRSTALKNQLSD
jgi:hypothetical protein